MTAKARYERCREARNRVRQMLIDCEKLLAVSHFQWSNAGDGEGSEEAKELFMGVIARLTHDRDRLRERLDLAEEDLSRAIWRHRFGREFGEE